MFELLNGVTGIRCSSNSLNAAVRQRGGTAEKSMMGFNGFLFIDHSFFRISFTLHIIILYLNKKSNQKMMFFKFFLKKLRKINKNRYLLTGMLFKETETEKYS